ASGMLSFPARPPQFRRVPGRPYNTEQRAPLRVAAKRFPGISDMEYVIGAAVGAAVMLFLVVLGGIARAGSLGGVFQGLGVAGKAKQDPAFAAKLQAILAGAEIKPVEPPKPPKPSGAPLRMLALLQAEARLVDFLMEDIGGAADAQIGQAVRE